MDKSRKLKNPLIVVVKNPPTKDVARNIIQRISKELSNLYSQKLNELEEIK